VFGWTEFFTVYIEKHCLCWNVVRGKYWSGWENKPTSQPNTAKVDGNKIAGEYYQKKL